MFTRSILVLSSLALPLVAQEGAVKPASAESATIAFYKAYFLDNDQARSKEATQKAIELYQGFLAANAEHELAGKAASRCLILLYSTGDLKAARSFLKQHEALITKAEQSEVEARRAQGDTELQGKLREALQAAREDGDDAEARRLMVAMGRVGGMRFGQGGPGMGGRGFGGRGAGGGRGAQQLPKIADMSKEEATKAVERMVTQMERMIDFLANQGQADKADALEAKLDKIQDLVDDGKMAEAQKIIDGLQEELGNMRGAGRGGRGAGDGRRRREGQDGGNRQPPPGDGDK